MPYVGKLLPLVIVSLSLKPKFMMDLNLNILIILSLLCYRWLVELKKNMENIMLKNYYPKDKRKFLTKILNVLYSAIPLKKISIRNFCMNHSQLNPILKIIWLITWTLKLLLRLSLPNKIASIGSLGRNNEIYILLEYSLLIINPIKQFPLQTFDLKSKLLWIIRNFWYSY
jgi:hypothetical protein